MRGNLKCKLAVVDRSKWKRHKKLPALEIT